MPADEQDRQRNPDFSDFRRICGNDYPVAISSNLDVLYRVVLRHWNIYGRGKGLAWLREMVAARYLCEYRYIKNKFSNKTHSTAKLPPQSSESLVLVPFVPCRRDYQAFIYPVTNMLSERGISTFIMVSRKSYLERVDARLFSGSQIIFSDDFLTLHTYRRAKKHYSELVPWLNELNARLRLEPWQCRHVQILFQDYCLDKEILGSVLSLIRPSAVYGIHYIWNPGYLAAINEMRGDELIPIKLLIQHGANKIEDFHDFKGADCVILWGDHFKAVLNSGRYLIPVPQYKVIGNPKLEVEVRKREERTGHSGCPDPLTNKKVILFVSTLDGPGGDYNRKALRIFASSMRNFPGEWSVIYRPHPGDFDNLDYCRDLIQNGTSKREQVLDLDMDIYELFKRADVVIGTNSTVIPEAMGFGKPVIQILPDFSGTDWCEHGLLGVSTDEELHEALKGILGSDEYREQVLVAQQTLANNMFGEIVGTSQKITDYILTFL